VHIHGEEWEFATERHNGVARITALGGQATHFDPLSDHEQLFIDDSVMPPRAYFHFPNGYTHFCDHGVLLQTQMILPDTSTKISVADEESMSVVTEKIVAGSSTFEISENTDGGVLVLNAEASNGINIGVEAIRASIERECLGDSCEAGFMLPADVKVAEVTLEEFVHAVVQHEVPARVCASPGNKSMPGGQLVQISQRAIVLAGLDTAVEKKGAWKPALVFGGAGMIIAGGVIGALGVATVNPALIAAGAFIGFAGPIMIECGKRKENCQSERGGLSYSKGIDCRTLAGTRCRVPFRYKGKQYASCTTADWHTHWCATGTDSNGDYNGLWGNCDFSSSGGQCKLNGR